MDKWQGKVVIVTGASKGIGRSLALCLANHGLKVVAAARSAELLQELTNECQNKGFKGTIEGIKCDMSKVEDICQLFKHVEQKYGALHACINNAGMSVGDYFLPPAKGEKYDAERNEHEKMEIYKRWKTILDVDVLGLTICSKEAVNLMAKTGVKDGLVINVSSLVGQQIFLMKFDDSGLYNHMYNAVKWAVSTITQVLRLEIQQHTYACGTRIMTLCPGVVKTSFMDNIIGGKPKDDPFSSYSYLTPEQVADAVLAAFVCDPNVQLDILTIQPTRDPKKLPFP